MRARASSTPWSLPFVCDGRTRFGGPSLQGLEYHDARLEPVIDFRQWAKGDPERCASRNPPIGAGGGDRAACLRGADACGAPLLSGHGHLQRQSVAQRERSQHAELAGGRPGHGFEHLVRERAGSGRHRCGLAAVRANARGIVGRSPLPPDAGRPLVEEIPHTALESNLGAVVAAGGWRLSSYSGLNFGAKGEQAANDVMPAWSRRPAARSSPRAAEDDILRFPRGASAGECIHAVFENIDFTDESTWDPGIAAALERHPQARPGILRQSRLRASPACCAI